MSTSYDFKTQDILSILAKSASKYDSDPSKFTCVVEYIYEVCREDAFRYERILSNSEESVDIRPILIADLKKIESPQLADKTAAILSGFIVHDVKYRNPADIETLANSLIAKETKCSTAGVLTVIASLLKVPKFRAHLWNISGVHTLIRSSLSPNKNDPQVQYQATICTWLFSFNEKFVPHIVESGILIRLLQIMKDTPKKENIIRLGIEVVGNAINCNDAVQLMLDENLGDVLDLYLFEKWRSEDLYARIEEIITVYTRKIREWSTFERYTKELDSGRLSPGYLHQDEFFAENIMEFESNEFLTVRKLIALLRSNDPVTISIACHDLGEFARLHPTGKNILHKLHAKDMLLALMGHQDRDVERESLLSIQKLMLDNWEVVGSH